MLSGRNPIDKHIAKTLNEKGKFVYEVQNGAYKGLTTADRIPFLLFLKATDPSFNVLEQNS